MERKEKKYKYPFSPYFLLTEYLFAHLYFPIPCSNVLSCPNFLLMELKFEVYLLSKFFTVNVVSIHLRGRLLPFPAFFLFLFNPPLLHVACPLRELGQ